MIRVTVWNEFRHEKEMPEVAAIYPNGIHGAIAVQIRVRVLLFVVLLRYLNGSIGGAGGNTQAQQIFQKSHNTTS